MYIYTKEIYKANRPKWHASLVAFSQLETTKQLRIVYRDSLKRQKIPQYVREKAAAKFLCTIHEWCTRTVHQNPGKSLIDKTTVSFAITIFYDSTKPAMLSNTACQGKNANK